MWKLTYVFTLRSKPFKRNAAVNDGRYVRFLGDRLPNSYDDGEEVGYGESRGSLIWLTHRPYFLRISP